MYIRAPETYGRGSGREHTVTGGKEARGIYPDLCLDMFSFLAPVPPLGQTQLELETEKAGNRVVKNNLIDTKGRGRWKGRWKRLLPCCSGTQQEGATPNVCHGLISELPLHTQWILAPSSIVDTIYLKS